MSEAASSKGAGLETVGNPWRRLPAEAPYVLGADAPYVDYFNRSAQPAHRIDTRLLPEPMFGPHAAPVVVLLLNPGLGDSDAQHHRREDFRDALREHLAAEQGAPHFHLLDETQGPGRVWWHRQCTSLIDEVGLHALARGTLCLEFFPYHSQSFAHGHLRLPSQRFTFELLKRAIDRGALVLCMRGLRLWCGAVPNLAGYAGLIAPANPRSAALSTRNLGASGYARVCAALASAAN